jgi:hypothetical protein
MKPEDIEWSHRTFSMMAEGGTWGVPRSGLIFKRKENSLILTCRMPWKAEMPLSAIELKTQQDSDYGIIKRHFEAAGVTVSDESIPEKP